MQLLLTDKLTGRFYIKRFYNKCKMYENSMKFVVYKFKF